MYYINLIQTTVYKQFFPTYIYTWDKKNFKTLQSDPLWLNFESITLSHWKDVLKAKFLRVKTAPLLHVHLWYMSHIYRSSTSFGIFRVVLTMFCHWISIKFYLEYTSLIFRAAKFLGVKLMSHWPKKSVKYGNWTHRSLAKESTFIELRYASAKKFIKSTT